MDAARPILITGPRAELLAGQLGPAAASLSIQRVASPEEILLRAQDSQCVLVVIDGGQAASTAVLCEELSRLEIPSLVLSDDSAVAARLAAAGARAILPSTSPLGPTVQRLLVEQHASESRATAVRDLQRAASLLRDQICSMEQRERDQAHEIRTPVGIIRLFAHNLKDGLDGELTELQAESVDAIMRAAEQLVDLVSTPMGGSPVPDYIESLLERRPEQRRTKRTQVDFNEFASGVVALFSVEAARAGHRLELELQPDLPRPWLDRSQITQVLSNLLSNAIKFTPSGGRIVVSAREETPSKGPSSRRLGGEVRLSVTDDGPGIPEADLERIFEHNDRGSSAVTTALPGSGIGLAVVRELIEAHGGRVWAESVPGQGSSIHVIMPVDFRTRRLGNRVLAIEDERDAAELLTALAELQGRRLIVFDPGDHDSRVQALLSGEVSLVVTGSATVAALREQDGVLASAGAWRGQGREDD